MWPFGISWSQRLHPCKTLLKISVKRPIPSPIQFCLCISVAEKAKPFVRDTQTQDQTHKTAFRQAHFHTNTDRQETREGMEKEE